MMNRPDAVASYSLGPAVRLFPTGYGRKDQDWTNGLDAATGDW